LIPACDGQSVSQSVSQSDGQIYDG